MLLLSVLVEEPQGAVGASTACGENALGVAYQEPFVSLPMFRPVSGIGAGRSVVEGAETTRQIC